MKTNGRKTTKEMNAKQMLRGGLWVSKLDHKSYRDALGFPVVPFLHKGKR